MLTERGKTVGLAALLAIIGGFLVSYPLLIAFGVALGIALLVGVVSVIRTVSMTCRQLISPGQVSAGERCSTRLTVLNTGATASPPLIATNRLGAHDAAVAVPSLGPGEAHETELVLGTEQRGVFGVGPISISRVGPLGLTKATDQLGSVLKLVVYPKTHQMSALPTGQRRELEGVASRRPQEGGISFHSLRDYVPGDDLRLVHWRSVAKTGELMVRKNIHTSEPRLMIVLDTSTSSYQGDEFEDAARIAASLVVAGCNSRYPVMFRTTNGQAADASASGEGQGQILRLLAEAELATDDAGLNAVVKFAEGVEGVSLGAVTGRPDPSQVVGVSRARSRFDMVTVIQLGRRAVLGRVEIPGALTIVGETSEEVAAKWQSTFR